MRQLILSPRWIFWHVLTLGAMATCGWLATWQWQRAGSAMGSALNVGYGLQWPVFAVFFAYMWWRLLSMEASKLDGDGPEPAAADDDPAEHPAGPADRTLSVPVLVQDAPAGSATSATGRSPFGPRPASAAPEPITDDDNPQLAAYNRMLAALAARDAER